DAGEQADEVVLAAKREDRIDEVVATFFPGPRSYTAEDVVEISAHGSLELLSEIVRAAMAAGARLAEPGEFTLRAFLNGRLDLVQAEAVADLVAAVTPLQARVAFDQLEGTLTSAIAGLDAELFELAAKLEASVDFPDEGYHFVAADQTREALRRVQSGVEALLSTAPRGRMIREGRHIAILGKPNVGKSSLFNELVGTDRAIVTALPGTTRDLLRETIDLDGIRLGLVDTAGIRLSDSEVEREGVVRARRAAAVADLVVLVLDQSRPMEVIDESLLSETAGNSRVVVANKADLASAWTRDGVVVVSLKTGAGVDSLRAAMLRALNAAEPLRDGALITNLRHEALLREAHASLARAIGNLEQAGESACEELVLADIADARRAFEEVTGKRSSEDLLAAIFERFCIGK
ncbi:MAG: tRNA uridine-5-carboxymethylaminomethyl(34) synthesis GTPase MnmE, partial [Acidobacteria bacterium]|nr:tRNA uridine-5-carboxymethylaminomethyl(34) synthesis GTPase MnmE [Acidobacteriota bacterium]